MIAPFWDGREAGSPECSYAKAACWSRLFGNAATPLAEKYSLRRSFRRKGRGALEIGSLPRGETLKRRLGTMLAVLDRRMRHLGQREELISSTPR